MQSDVLPLPSDPRWRRLLGLALFLALLFLFRNLAPVFICFIVFARALGAIADFVDRKTALERFGATLVTLLAFFAALAVAAGGLALWLVPRLRTAREDGAAYADYIAQHPLFEAVRQHLGGGGEDFVAVLKEHALNAVHYATATAHVAIYLALGMLLAIMYLLERREIDHWFASLPSLSVPGTILRWFGYVGDAIAVTVKLQVVVSLFNALLTLPVVLFLGLPHALVLFALLLVTGLIPFVGSFISGAILCVVAYSTKGAWAVAVFLAITFVVAKIEGYVLTPRLAAQHVKLPALLMVVSLLLFEQVFGFIGLFLSFPALYVATRIYNEWRSPPGEGAPGEAAVAEPGTAEPGAAPGAPSTPEPSGTNVPSESADSEAAPASHA